MQNIFIAKKHILFLFVLIPYKETLVNQDQTKQISFNTGESKCLFIQKL